MTAVEKIIEEINNELQTLEGFDGKEITGSRIALEFVKKVAIEAKEMEKEQRGYTESDMRSYASYILNNPVIEPSQWYKIYRTKSE